MEGRPVAERRLDPDAAAVHLHNVLGDREPQPSATLGLGKGAVDLVELLEDARLVFLRYPRTSVGNADSKVIIDGGRADSDRSNVGELDRIAHKVEQHLCKPLLVAKADRQGRGDLRL